MSRFVLTAQLQLQAPSNVRQVVSQIQNQLQGINVQVNVQAATQAQRQVQQLATNTNQAADASNRLGRNFGQAIRRYSALAIATRAVSLFTNTLGNAIKESIAFERELIKIVQVTGQTAQELQFLTNTVSRLSTTLGVSSSSLLNVSRILSQAGFSARETEVALGTLARTDLAPTFDNITQTAEGAVAIFNQFRQGAEALESQLGAINAVAGKFAVESGDIIAAVRRTGGVFKAAGGNLNELIALFTSVRATTRESAESISTGLRTIFTRIQRPKTIEYLKKFGVELTDLEGKFVGPYEAIRRLSSALAGLEEGDITFVEIAEELGGFRQIGKVIPLLQQFSVAQEALNVAQGGSASLAKDAAIAQLSLAVQVMRVKEEFMDLVRGITATPTFQIMAKTALNLASALIQVADALKPILPIVTAIAAVRFARGIGGFMGGIMGGMNARGFNKGGKVLAFANGGLVPGSRSGPEDDIDARVSGGEFIMKREAVKRIGAGTLAAMNDNKYAGGGAIKINPGAIGGFFLRPAEGQDRKGASINEMISVTGTKALSALGAMSADDPKLREEAFLSATKKQQAKILNVEKLPAKVSSPEVSLGGKNKKKIFTAKGDFAQKTGLKADDKANDRLTETIAAGNIKLGKGSKFAKQVPLSGNISSYFPGTSDLENNTPIASIVAEKTRKGLMNTILNAIDPIVQQFNNPVIAPDKAQARKGAKRIANDANARATTEGFIFEGLIQSLTSARLAGGQQVFDFPQRSISTARSALKAMFTDSSGEGMDSLIKADAKRSNTPDAVKSIANKIKNDINRGNFAGVSFQKFAAGTTGRGVKQSKGILPTPGKAIDSLIKAGGGFVDIDRTLLRTVGDNAYARAKTEEQRQAVLKQYFQNPAARLKDIKQAGLTAFGKELQLAVKSGKLQGSRLRVVSKSQEVAGLRQYLSGLFGIPAGNMTFTKGGSKIPFIQGKGPLVDDITSNARFASGGMVPGTGNRDTVPAVLEAGSFVIKKSSVNSIGASNLASAPKYASGGEGSGVPALVTPGEWVYSKKEAQSIGYGKLNRMNKFGKYAKGGPVGIQRFARGGAAQGGGGGGITGFGAANEALFGLQMAIGMLTPTIDENSTAFERMTANLLNSANSLASVLFLVTTSFTALNGQLTAQNINKAFTALTSRGKGGLGDIIGGFQRQGGTTVRAKGESVMEGVATSRKQYTLDRKIRLEREQSFQQFGPATRGQPLFAQQRSDQAQRLRALRTQRASISNPQSLTGKLGSYLGKKSLGGGMVGRVAGAAARGLSAVGGSLGGGAVGAFGASLAAAAGPITAFVAGMKVAGMVVSSFRDLDARLKDAIKAEDTAAASKLAVSKAAEETFGGVIAGLASYFPIVESALVDFASFCGGQSVSAIKADIALRIQSAKTAKALTEAEKLSAEAMEDLKNGTISAADGLAKVTAKTQEAAKQQQMSNEAIMASAAGKAGGISGVGRETLAYLSLGYVDSNRERNEGIDAANQKRSEEAMQARQKAIGIERELSTTTARSIFAGGGSIDDAKAKLQAAGATTPESLRKEARQLSIQAQKADIGGDTETAKLLRGQAAMLDEEAKQFQKALENLEKEVKKQIDAFKAMNLGLNTANGAANAMSTGLKNYLASQEAGNLSISNSMRTLEASMTSAAVGIKDADFKAAMGEIDAVIKQYSSGTSDFKKFRANMEATYKAQKGAETGLKNFQKILQKDLQKGVGAMTDEQKFESFFDEVIKAAGPMSAEAEKALKDQLAAADIDYEKISMGDFSQVTDILGEVGEKQLKQFQAIVKAEEEYLSAVRDITKRRLDAENNLVSAAKRRVDLEMESREIIASAGGPAVTADDRRAANLRKANLTAGGVRGMGGITGVSAMRDTSVASLRQRGRELYAAQDRQAKERQRVASDTTGTAQLGGGGAGGQKFAEEEARTAQASKELYDTIKTEIDIRRQEVKIIQEKNKLEKDSMESLLAGDIEGFFDKQSTMGAIGAIQTGRTGDFSADDLYKAYQEIKRQADAGVTEIGGQQIQGAGGLLERAAAATAEARGLDPQQAAMVAGTATQASPEEQRLNNEIQNLASILPGIADLEGQAALNQITAANMQLKAAETRKNESIKEAEASVSKARGGLIYASRGRLINFIPKGTDTIPAMLTPGEFVVNRSAVQRGNNLNILKAMNQGSRVAGAAPAPMSRGGVIYRDGGSTGAESGTSSSSNMGFDSSTMSKFTDALTKFNDTILQSITTLQSTKFTIQLAPTTVNVNLTGTSFLQTLTEDLQGKLMNVISARFNNLRVDSNTGRVIESAAEV